MRVIRLIALSAVLMSAAAFGEGSPPDLGETMSMIRRHHAKLYFAARAESWDLAAYELNKIKEGMDEAGQARHVVKTVKAPLKDLISITMNRELERLADAIGKRHMVAFNERFRALTVSCNKCHQAAEHPFIVIQVPVAPEFSNQKF